MIADHSFWLVEAAPNKHVRPMAERHGRLDLKSEQRQTAFIEKKKNENENHLEATVKPLFCHL